VKLVIKVGSICEAEDERGIAHIIEHLAFRANKKSKENFETIRYLEKMGIAFGAHQNAYTSFHETVYELHVPVEDKTFESEEGGEEGGEEGNKYNLLHKCLAVLRQMALAMRISDEDVNAERSIVMEEWRKGQNVQGRAMEAYWKMLFKGSKYPDRFPIGTVDVIKRVAPQKLRDFHSSWYQPENMALIVVGDFGPAERIGSIVALVERVFAGATQPSASPRLQQPAVPVPTHAGLMVNVFADPEATGSSIVLECKRPTARIETLQEYRAHVVAQLFHTALNHRLTKVAMKGHPQLQSTADYGPTQPPFLNAKVCVCAVCVCTHAAPRCTCVTHPHPPPHPTHPPPHPTHPHPHNPPPLFTPQSYSGSPVGSWLPSVSTVGLSISAEGGMEMRALQGALMEVLRVRLHGFTAAEIAIVKADMRSDLEMQVQWCVWWCSGVCGGAVVWCMQCGVVQWCALLDRPRDAASSRTRPHTPLLTRLSSHASPHTPLLTRLSPAQGARPDGACRLRPRVCGPLPE
jgi:hypothetical protein